jgi:hypothetical protein
MDDNSVFAAGADLAENGSSQEGGEVLEDDGSEFEVAPPVKEDTLDAELDHTVSDPGDVLEPHLEGDTPLSLDALSQGAHSDDSEQMNDGEESSHDRNTALQISPRPRDQYAEGELVNAHAHRYSIPHMRIPMVTNQARPSRRSPCGTLCTTIFHWYVFGLDFVVAFNYYLHLSK